MDGVVSLHILDVEYSFNYYYSAGTLEKSPFKVSISRSWHWGNMFFCYGAGSFYAIEGNVVYDDDKLLKITVLESNENYVILLVERV